MSDFERVAIVGTGQVAPSSAEQTGTPVDAMIAGEDRERALLLRAGGLALLTRAARAPLQRVVLPTPANEETLRPCSAKLGELLAPLLDASADGVLMEALTRMASARMRLPEELLPVALQQRSATLRDALRPVLGERGRWLARLREDWRWVLSSELPTELEARWEDANSGERRLLLAAARREDAARARTLAEASWKQEKAEQRLAWLELFEHNLSRDDEAFLSAALTDRSANVRVAAARLLWRLPESELAQRVRARVDALLSLRDTLVVELPPEEFAEAWAREGIVEAPLEGYGRRQWWLAQMLSAVPPDHWCARFAMSPAQLVAAAAAHDLAFPLLDGLTTAALRHHAERWYAPLYDLAPASSRPCLSDQPQRALAARMASADAEPRMLAALDANVGLWTAFAAPWPRKAAEAFLAALHAARVDLAALLPAAALAIPVELLPETMPIPEFAETNYAAHSYLRLLDQLQTIASARRAIAQEITP